MSGRSGGNQIGIEESLSTSEVAQSTGEALPLGFDVNICDNIIYISGGGVHLHLSLSSPPSLLWRLKHTKVIWTKSDTLQWQKKENDTAICWWYGDERGRRWKCERRKTDSNVFLNA